MPARSAAASTIRELIARATARLDAAGVPDARLEAEWLLAGLLGVDRGGLLVRRDDRLAHQEVERYDGWIARRARREPAQQIVGTQEFHGLEFLVDRRVLIPRPETEDVVVAALGLDLPPGASVADLGTGSGCLAVTLAVRRSDLELVALDASQQALELARINAVLHGVAQRIEFVHGDFGSPPAAWRGRMQLVVSNPPYVAEAEWDRLQPEVRDHEPREALVGGPTGVEAYASLVPAAAELLRPGGHLVLELGLGQSEAVRAVAERAGMRLVEIRDDFQGIPRVLVARLDP
jgi:release factor glutamine methyltransferase